MNILHIDSGILGEHSVSRRLTAAIIDQIKVDHPEASVVYRDVAAHPLAHLSGAHLAAGAARPEDLDPVIGGDLGTAQAVLEEFLAADTVVIGAPMYNFAIPSQLKAWIDRIAVAGKTFRYSESGVEGLAKGKKVIIASTRGGHYSEGPAAAMDHQESYLKAVLGFFGITDVEFVRAEGLNISPESKQYAIAEAEKSILRDRVWKMAG